MARTQIEFFATRADLIEVVADVERQRPLTWVRAGLFDRPTVDALDSLLSIADLGVASAASTAACPAFLVAWQPFGPVVRPVVQRRGGTKHAVDQLSNPTTIVLRTGGVREPLALLASSLGTASGDPASLELYETFRRVLLTRFSQIKSYRVGPDAARLLDAGWRLTTDVSSPAPYDLSRS